MDFTDIAILLVTAAGFGIFAKILKQPLLVGYLFAGLFVALTGSIHDLETLEGLGQIGVALLLFLLGLEMNVRDLTSVGKVALLTGLGQIIFTSVIGFAIAMFLGFDTLPSVYIAVAMTFSSTIIMVKLLSEKNSLSSLYGKIAVGFLLVQDFVALLILMVLAGLGSGEITYFGYFMVLVKIVLLFVAIAFLSKTVLPKIFTKVSNSSELLFVVSIAWALGVAAFVAGPLGFSPEIGGFLAGIALSNLPSHLQIANKTKPLRDFFLVIFFLLLGTRLVVEQDVIQMIPMATLFSVFVLLGNPLIVMAIMGFMGYRKRTSFRAGLTVAQISEFSLILMTVGLALGHVGNTEVTLVVLVGVVTMTLSTYMISGSDTLYNYVGRYLSFFERKNTKEEAYIKPTQMSGHIVLVGADRTGRELARYFTKRKRDFVVVDFNPKVFTKLTADGVPVVFGDITDSEVLDAANISESRMIISTVADSTSDTTLLEYLRGKKNNPVTVLRAPTREDAIKLYELGASYVVVPEVVAGEHISHLIDVYGTSESKFGKIGKSHFNRLVTK